LTVLRKHLLAWVVVFQSASLAHAAPPPSSNPVYTGRPQGTMLWGTKGDWDGVEQAEENRSVLVSADLESLRLEKGHLVAVPAPSLQPGAPAGKGVVGTVLQGTASDGNPVRVAISAAEPSSEDPQLSWYRIEAWNSLAQKWENPCVGLASVPNPRVLAVSGIWDASGAHHDVPGKFTFACENGAITKCITWGYKPWESHNGHSLADLHQACTRMARADYCGNGRHHTRQDTLIASDDGLGVGARTTGTSVDFDLTRASFEAAWAPDGATCLARTRDGRPLETVLQECPTRFRAGTGVELGRGELCAVQRTDEHPVSALLRNQSYLPKAAAP
jgi:hypothetical protein